MRVGEMSIKYPKRKWNRTEGRGHKDFKGGGGKLGQGVGALKRGGARTPLGTMEGKFITGEAGQIRHQDVPRKITGLQKLGTSL